MTESRHPTTSRGGEGKKETADVFVEKVLALGTWAKANSQTLVLVGIVIVVIGAGGIYYANYRGSVEEQATAQLEEVQQAVALGEREAAKATLYEYLDRFEGTAHALEARLILGQVLLEGDDPEAAMDVLAPAVRAMDKEPIGIQAAFLLAAAYENAGRLEESERLFLRIADGTALPFQIQEALAGAARIRARNGDWTGVVELYDDLLAGLDETDPNRTYWEMRRAEAAARG